MKSRRVLKFVAGPICVCMLHVFSEHIYHLFEFCDVMLLFSVHSARIDGRRKRDQLGKSI